MPDFRQLTEELSRLGSEMERARVDLQTSDVHGVSPDGMVSATVRAGRLAALTINPGAMEQDPVRLANQVLAAVRDCETRSAEVLMRRMTPMVDEVEQTSRGLD